MTSTQLNTARHLGLCLSTLQTILLLADHGELPLGTIAERIGVLPSTITNKADLLIKKGYAARVPCVADRRAIMLRLTGAGEQAHYQLTGRELCH